MTLITIQDGKIVLRDGKVGTEQACCCGGDEPCECPTCEAPEANCFILSFVCMNWSGCVCCNLYNPPDGAIAGPLNLLYQGDNTWVASSATQSASLSCVNGVWEFAFFNFAQDGTWSVVGSLGSACGREDPCDVDGLTGVGDAEWDLTYDPNEPNCVGSGTVDLEITMGPCVPC
jgi:hypothetical protein